MKFKRFGVSVGLVLGVHLLGVEGIMQGRSYLAHGADATLAEVVVPRYLPSFLGDYPELPQEERSDVPNPNRINPGLAGCYQSLVPALTGCLRGGAVDAEECVKGYHEFRRLCRKIYLG